MASNIPTYDLQLSAPAARLPQTATAADFGGAFAAVLGQTAQEVQARGNQAADTDLLRQKAARSQIENETRVGMLTDLTGLRKSYENDQDPATMPDRWEADTGKLLDKYKTQLGDNTGLFQTLKLDFQEYKLRERSDIDHMATTKLAATGRAKLDGQLTDLTSLAADSQDEARSTQIRATASIAIQDALSAGFIGPEEAVARQQKFAGEVSEAQARGLINSNPAAAMAALKDPAQFAGLAPVGRQQLYDMAQSELKRQAAEARAAAAEARQALQSEILAGYDDAKQTAYMTGKLPDGFDKILVAFPGKTGQRMIGELKAAAGKGIDGITIASQSLAADVAMLDELKPQPGEGAAAAADRYDYAARLIAQKQQAVKEDPAEWVYRNNRAVASAWADAKDEAGVKAAVALTRQAQLDLGVPEAEIRTMPKQQAAALVQQIATARPGEVAAVVDGVVSGYGVNGLRDLERAGAPATVKAIAFADQPAQAIWRNKLVAAQQLPAKDTESLLQGRGVTKGQIEDALAPLFAPIQNALPKDAAPYYEAARAVAIYNVTQGMDKDAAAADAVKAFTDTYDFSAGYRVPKVYDAGRVEAGLDAVIMGIDKFDIAPPTSYQPGLDDAHRKTETIRALQAGHYRWMTNSNDDGVILTYDDGSGQPVMLTDGSRLELKFGDLAAGKYGTYQRPGGRIGVWPTPPRAPTSDQPAVK